MRQNAPNGTKITERLGVNWGSGETLTFPSHFSESRPRYQSPHPDARAEYDIRLLGGRPCMDGLALPDPGFDLLHGA